MWHPDQADSVRGPLVSLLPALPAASIATRWEPWVSVFDARDYPDPVQWIEWLVGILLTVAGISVIYAGFLYYGFERVSRPSPSRFNTWVWIGLAAGLGAIAVAVMVVTGLIR